MRETIYRTLGMLVCVLGVASFSVVAAPASAQTVPDGFQVRTVAGGLTYPTSMAFAPDGRIFVTEKSGAVRVIKDGELLSTPVITLPDVNDFLDRGLLGIATHPDFEDNGYLYLSYTHENSPENYEGPKVGKVIRVTVTGDTADLSSRETIVGSVSGSPDRPSCDDFAITDDCIFSSSPSHSVGGLRFGPDDKLYISLGDGAEFAFADPKAEHALNLDALAGKILRVNDDGTAPSDNPFYNGDPNANRSKVWSYGLRNPYRFNFRPLNDELFVADVGWGHAEEVNVNARGANFGWPCREGYSPTSYDCSTEDYTDPIYTYPHNEDGIGSITGGDFPEGGAYPEEYTSSYYFGDYSQGFIKQMKLDANNNVVYVDDFVQSAGGPVDILTGPDGALYYVDIYNGSVRKVIYSEENQAPIARIGASPTAGEAPLAVSFTGDDSSDPDGDDLTFFWEFGDGSAPSAEANPPHVYESDGTYAVTLTVEDSAGNTDTASMTISVGESVEANADPSHEGTVVTPSSPNIGTEVTITSTIHNSGADDPFIVDIEIYNDEGEQISQEVFDGVTIESGQSEEFSYTWFPPTPDTYRVAVGLFQPNWSGLYEWTDEARMVEVRNRVPDNGEMDLAHQSTTVSPQVISVGEVSTITTTVDNSGGAGSGLVDIEVYKDGEQVAQEFFDGESFAAGESREYSFDWQAEESGDYTVSVGLFESGWSPLHEWVSDVASISVQSATGGDAADIYQESLVEGWANWSWSAGLDFSSYDTSSEGSRSMRVDFYEPWSGLYLHHDGLSVAGSDELTFAISGGSSGGQSLKVFLYDERGNAISARPLSDYTSQDTLSANSWIDVEIPLSDLGAGSTITGFAIQGRDGSVQPAFYLDDITIE